MAHKWLLILKIAFVWAILASLYGCAVVKERVPNTVYVHTTIDKSVKVPEDLLLVHPATEPPQQHEFLPFVPKTRTEAVQVLTLQRDLLLRYCQDLLADIKINQDRILAIKTLVEKTKDKRDE